MNKIFFVFSIFCMINLFGDDNKSFVDKSLIEIWEDFKTNIKELKLSTTLKFSLPVIATLLCYKYRNDIMANYYYYTSVDPAIY